MRLYVCQTRLITEGIKNHQKRAMMACGTDKANKATLSTAVLKRRIEKEAPSEQRQGQIFALEPAWVTCGPWG